MHPCVRAFLPLPKTLSFFRSFEGRNLTLLMAENLTLDRIEDALAALQAGKLIIVVDDEDRENEGDFIGIAETITPEAINFMAREGRGLICAALTEERCEALELPPMVPQTNAVFETAFTVSVDLMGYGCTTGISAEDRAKTVRALVNPDTHPEELGRPGHIFPLRARKGGVLRRAGHTEATVDFARLAGFQPAGVLVEIMNEDGTMARLPDLRKVADKHNLPLVSIQDLITYRLQQESLIRQEPALTRPTEYAMGEYRLLAFTQQNTGETHLALCRGEWSTHDEVLVRVQATQTTGDPFQFAGLQANPRFLSALERIDQEGAGVLLFMNQRTQKTEEEDDLTHSLRRMDERDYGVGAQILRELDIRKIRLLTSSPKRRVGITAYGLHITDVVEL